MRECYQLKLNNRPVLVVYSFMPPELKFTPKMDRKWLRQQIIKALRNHFRRPVVSDVDEQQSYSTAA
jgi:hypothetical protein